jgi:hypothetical protein
MRHLPQNCSGHLMQRHNTQQAGRNSRAGGQAESTSHLPDTAMDGDGEEPPLPSRGGKAWPRRQPLADLAWTGNGAR